MNDLLKTFNLSFHALVRYLPALFGGIACFIITIFVANFLAKVVSKYSLKRTKDGLISHFIGKIFWSVTFILGTVLTLGILGLGTISNKILAGAGITTFIVGFALKDIGENFLSGLILAFSRPYKVGNLIECVDIKGVVRDMTLRQTTIESDNGKIVLIPNSSIINRPLSVYKTITDLSQEFSVSVDIEHARDAIKLISETVNKFHFVNHSKEKEVKVLADSLSSDRVKITITYWFDSHKLPENESTAKSEVMLLVFQELRKAGYQFRG
jgi:small conductance mechanosensitive channel